jgi:hypothetical protein
MIPWLRHKIANPIPPVANPDVMVVAASQGMQNDCQIAGNLQYFPSGPYAALQAD